MKAHQLKQIREGLQFGDISMIAREVGVTNATVQRSLRGEAMTETTKTIISYAQLIIQQRVDRQEQLRRIIAKQREARVQSGDQ